MQDQNLTAAQQQQLAVLQLAEVMKEQKEMLKLSSRCYQQCNPGAPSKQLSSSQKTCVWRCAQRWTESKYFLNQYLMSQAGAQKDASVDGTMPLRSVKDPTEGYFA
ncbi:unnamed protein product [Amoebophrya sp. A120]|nr:unnamed protein product [Amoebophrya sp. A120]|eukprot:GSA120T00006942001.1